ncbi:hypothetical protein V6N12_070985 [Hibiscus sabdariffa]|uniref:Secreted protein n=1 Tax=Hibiscus sabdariffa TaxID=183260 RepID=A0ABR2FIN7_9ROSI
MHKLLFLNLLSYSNSMIFLYSMEQSRGASEVTYWEWTWAAATGAKSNSIALSLACAGCTLPGNPTPKAKKLFIILLRFYLILDISALHNQRN